MHCCDMPPRPVLGGSQPPRNAALPRSMHTVDRTSGSCKPSPSADAAAIEIDLVPTGARPRSSAATQAGPVHQTRWGASPVRGMNRDIARASSSSAEPSLHPPTAAEQDLRTPTECIQASTPVCTALAAAGAALQPSGAATGAVRSTPPTASACARPPAPTLHTDLTTLPAERDSPGAAVAPPRAPATSRWPAARNLKLELEVEGEFLQWTLQPWCYQGTWRWHSWTWTAILVCSTSEPTICQWTVSTRPMLQAPRQLPHGLLHA